jgi:hypothetical protein
MGYGVFGGCDLTILCNPGSFAESYAADNGIPSDSSILP